MKFVRLASTLLLVAPLTVAAAGGTIVRLDGTAAVDRKGTKSPLSEASPVHSGDTLIVAANSKAQVHFEDDSVFAVPGAAALKVDQFTMPSRTSGGSAIYTLQRGGFRTVTGRVGKNPGDQYEVRTDQGVITVSGSAYSTLICTQQCGRRYKAGLYVRNEGGSITLKNNAGELKLRPGQVAFAENNRTAPIVVATSPLSDPHLAARFGIDVEFAAQVHPPRVEQQPPASP